MCFLACARLFFWMNLMILLIALLLGEQVLSYIASYHTAQGAVRT